MQINEGNPYKTQKAQQNFRLRRAKSEETIPNKTYYIIEKSDGDFSKNLFEKAKEKHCYTNPIMYPHH